MVIVGAKVIVEVAVGGIKTVIVWAGVRLGSTAKVGGSVGSSGLRKLHADRNINNRKASFLNMIFSIRFR